MKETVAWDAANLAKAEKAQVKSMEGMPVYKSYSDGSKWVQLTRPGEFAQESDVMGHSVRGYEPQNQYLKNDTEYLSPDAHLTESQLSDIKTIVKKYTTDVDTYVQARDGEATFDYEAFLYDYPDAGNDVQTWTDKHIHSYVDNPDWIPESGSSGSAEYGVGTGGWEAIKNGSAKVYSLRDKNGRSHVTVEVDVRINDRTAIGLYEKETGKDWSDNSPGWNRPTPDYHKWIIQNADRIPKLNAITQIKGKGNAKPADRYLAQVRDFVQSGKWDDVEDLQNAGLINIRERELTKSLVQRIADLYGSDRYILTSEEFNKAQDVTWKNTPGRGPRNQQGSIDLELLLKGAAITGFAMVGYHYSDGVDKDGEPTNGKLIGALTAAGLTATALFVRGKNKSIAGEVLDHAVDAGVPISSEIRQISEPLLHHLTDHERVVYETIHQHFEKAAPFLQKFNELRFGTGTKGELNKKLGRESEGYRVLSRAILTGRAAITDKILTKLNNPELTAAWKQTRSLLDSVGDKLVALGRFKPGELEYFPRIVKDLEGLRTALNSKHRSVLDSALDAAQQKLNKKVSGTNIKARELTPLEQSLIINKVLRDQEWNSHLPGYAKDRRIDVIPDELLKHYYSPAESLHSYVRSAVKDIERAKFFGEHLKTAKSKGKLYTNLDDSIGAYVNQVLKDKDVTTDQRNRLLRILTARFGNGEKAPAKLIQMATNLSYASLLGDVMSATSQSADLVIALHTQGLVPTIEGLVRTVSRNKNIDVRAMGLADHMAEEFADTLRSSRFVNNLFKYSLFTGIDLFGKNVVLNAAVSKFGRMARTEAGQAKIRADYGKRMGTKEIDQFITDLNKGEVSDLVRTMAFTELSRTQPISKLELPLLHLDHPNTRFVYQYKTFMIKQLDLFNQDSLKLIQTGEPTKVAKGVYNFVKIGTLLGLGGAGTTYIKQYIKNVYASARGYETQNVEMKLSDIPINMFKTFALSQYSLDKITGVSKEEAERRREAEETGARQQKASPVGGLVNALAPTSIAETLDVIARHDKTALDKMPALGWLFKAERENKEAEENQ